MVDTAVPPSTVSSNMPPTASSSSSSGLAGSKVPATSLPSDAAVPPAKPNEGAGPGGHSWEATGKQTWETAVQEDKDGNIIVAGGDSRADLVRKRKKRLEMNDYAQKNRRVVRDMIRYLYVVLDCSRWVVTVKDPALGPGTRMDVVVQLLQEFVQEFYDQNPLSHLGFVVVRNGEAEILTQLSSSSKTHKLALTSISELAVTGQRRQGGEFSLQNGLEVAGRSLGHQPRHGSREVVVVCGALSTCDPGNVLTETLPRLKAARVRVSTIALAAEMHVCRKIADETGGVLGVSIDRPHLRDWLTAQCVPPPSLRKQHMDRQLAGCEMVQMGFPTRTKADIPTLVHATRETKLLARTSYTCPQCQAKISELPTDCVVCGLKLVLSPHLARSFHHLFPVAPFVEVAGRSVSSTDKIQDSNAVTSMPIVSSSEPASITSSANGLAFKPRSINGLTSHRRMTSRLIVTPSDDEYACFACMRMIGHEKPDTTNGGVKKGDEETVLRFRCPDCTSIFCVDCDSFLHETLHNCPGCLRLE